MSGKKEATIINFDELIDYSEWVNSLEEHYSPQFVENLPKVSLQNIDADMHFVETMNETMHQCQLSARKNLIN